MPSTTDKQIILNGVPVCWVFDVKTSAPAGVTDLWKFDNLGDATYKILGGASSSGSGDNIDITRSDGAIIRFPKSVPTISGIDESAVTSSTGGTDASGFGEITIVINESYIGATSWTAFIKAVQAKKVADAKFLIIVPTGYTYARKGSGNAAYPDGYCYMLGKITNNIEQQLKAGTPATLTLTFASQKATDWAPTAPLSFSGKGIAIKRGGSDLVPATNNVPSDLASGDITDLATLGKIVLTGTV